MDAPGFKVAYLNPRLFVTSTMASDPNLLSGVRVKLSSMPRCLHFKGAGAEDGNI